MLYLLSVPLNSFAPFPLFSHIMLDSPCCPTFEPSLLNFFEDIALCPLRCTCCYDPYCRCCPNSSPCAPGNVTKKRHPPSGVYDNRDYRGVNCPVVNFSAHVCLADITVCSLACYRRLDQ